ncbi:MAG: helix-turn-helix domain-containing protein [Proteobacteria bacterium]|nr:helix-turn-helix domain-containing protein [Pseudomonadota bacterium]
MAEGKKAKSTPETARAKDDSVGEMLRVARVSKNLGVEEVSVALRIRASQLRAIEENNIDALPGMTYAIGFVRSYANYVGLDGIDVVHKFRAEHGHAPAHTKLTFPEPEVESRMPDPLMVGIGAFLAIVALVLWTVYSNAHNGSSKVVEQIPPTPEVTAAPEMMSAPSAVESLLSHPGTPAGTTVPGMAAPAAPVAAGTTPSLSTVAVPAAMEKAAPVAPEQPAAAVPPTAETLAKPSSEKSSGTVEAATEAAVREESAEKPEPVINIKRGKSHIMLKSNQTSWVQVSDAHDKVIYKKVLKPGEQYYVPDQPGLSLVTANAGGLDVYVDGQKVAPFGKFGEIVRGIVLDPSGLKRRRIRVND